MISLKVSASPGKKDSSGASGLVTKLTMDSGATGFYISTMTAIEGNDNILEAREGDACMRPGS